MVRFYLKMGFLFLWVGFAAAVGLVWALFKSGDKNLLANWVRFCSAGALWISGIRVVVTGEENLYKQQPCVYVGNHQSAFDVFTFGFKAPLNTTIVAKKQAARLPLVGMFFKLAGVIFIDRKNRQQSYQALDGAAAEIRKRGVSVVMMPEGTRNEGGRGLLPFKNGAFHLALSAKVPLVVMVCSPLDEIGSFSGKRLAGGEVRVKILPPIPVEGLGMADLEGLKRTARERMLKALTEVAKEPHGLTLLN